MPSTISAGTTAGTAIAVAGDTTGNLAFQTNGTTTAMTIDTSQNVSMVGNLSFNSGYGSSAVAYGCRAWVNFNGSGTVAIRASGNVSSITDNGTGDYTVNFSTAMPDVNYSSSAFAWSSGKNATATKLGGTGSISNTTNPMSTSSVRVVTADNMSESSTFDATIVLVSVFR
jgi:uncharacterized protein (AIM24 family)